MPVAFAGIETRRRKIRAVRRVRPSLRFETERVGLTVKSAAFAGRAAIEEIARIELQARLVSQQFEHAAASRRFQPCRQSDAAQGRKAEIMIVAAAAPQLLVVGADSLADDMRDAKIERRAFDRSRRPRQRNRAGADCEIMRGRDLKMVAENIGAGERAVEIEETMVG